MYQPETAYATLATFNKGSQGRVEFKHDVVSLPACLGKVAEICNIASPEARSCIEGMEELMLRAQDEFDTIEQERGPIVAYSDRRLVGNRRVCSRFVRRLASLGLVRFTLAPLEEVGVFFVWKKGRTRMRMILDCKKVIATSLRRRGWAC